MTPREDYSELERRHSLSLRLTAFHLRRHGRPPPEKGDVAQTQRYSESPRITVSDVVVRASGGRFIYLFIY